MMTTMAAMLGGVPLMLGTGTGSEIRQPLGYAMVGGLIVSQALTLFTTPVIYLYLDKLSNAFAGWGRSANADLDRARRRARPDQASRRVSLLPRHLGVPDIVAVKLLVVMHRDRYPQQPPGKFKRRIIMRHRAAAIAADVEARPRDQIVKSKLWSAASRQAPRRSAMCRR